MFAQVPTFNSNSPVHVLGLILVFLILLALFFFLNDRRKKRKQAQADKDLLNQVNDHNSGNLLDMQRKLDELVNNQLLDQPLSTQRGEEELQQLTHSVDLPLVQGTNERVESVDKTQQEHVPQVDVLEEDKSLEVFTDNPTTEVFKKDTRTLEEKLKDTFYFHSVDFVNAHRYTAAGKYVADETQESGYTLVVAYAIVGEGDTFSRKVGREIAFARLDDATRNVRFSVTKEELEFPARAFNEAASTNVLLPALFDENISEELRSLANPNSYKLRDGVELTEVVKKQLEDYLDKVKHAKTNEFLATIRATKVFDLHALLVDQVQLLDRNASQKQVEVNPEPKVEEVDHTDQPQTENHTEQAI